MLKSGTQNPPAVRLNGKGAGLPHPPLPATAPVTVQLFNGSNGLCWGSSYTASQLINNQPWQLKAQAG